jgi:hypothetical protein
MLVYLRLFAGRNRRPPTTWTAVSKRESKSSPTVANDRILRQHIFDVHEPDTP